MKNENKMEEKIYNTIALHQMAIEEIRGIKNNVKENIDDIVRFRIETRCVVHRWEPYIAKIRNKLKVSPRTMLLILDEVERKEKEKIDQLIDMKINEKLKKNAT